MLILITPHNYRVHQDDLKALYHFRCTQAHGKQPKKDIVHEDRGKDEYDEQNMYYLLYKDDRGNIKGCLRFIEMIHPCMLDKHDAAALPDMHAVKRPHYWEISRIVIEADLNTPGQTQLSKDVALSLMIGYTLFTFEYESKCSFLIADPAVIAMYQPYGLIFAYPTGAHRHHENMSCALYVPLPHCYEALMQHANLDSTQAILWHNSGWYT